MIEIRKIWLQNVEALIRQEFEPVLKVVAAYEAGAISKDDILADGELAKAVRKFGTRIQAVAQYIEANYQIKPAEKAETPKKKAARKTEVKDNG